MICVLTCCLRLVQPAVFCHVKVRAGNISYDLEESDDSEGGICYPFALNLETRVTSVKMKIAKSTSETGLQWQNHGCCI